MWLGLLVSLNPLAYARAPLSDDGDLRRKPLKTAREVQSEHSAYAIAQLVVQ